MSKTLNLVDCLLAKARQLHELGRPQDSLPILRRLSRSPDLSQTILAELHNLLGEAYYELNQFGSARKHLRRALRLEPENCNTHHLLALAIESDAECDSSLAGRHHRRALELAPDSPDFLAAAGAYFVEVGRIRKGIELLQRAWELATDDFAILKSLVEALCEAERFDEARRTVNAARFRIGRDARIPALSADVELSALRYRQRETKSFSTADRVENAVILPFAGVTGGERKPVRAYRRDAALARLQRPHLLRRYDAEQA